VLALSRKIGETIVIGRDIRVTLVSIHGRTVRLAIEAPATVSILRGELDLGSGGPRGRHGSRARRPRARPGSAGHSRTKHLEPRRSGDGSIVERGAPLATIPARRMGPPVGGAHAEPESPRARTQTPAPTRLESPPMNSILDRRTPDRETGS
jgi:carbon storage regulator CsrA